MRALANGRKPDTSNHTPRFDVGKRTESTQPLRSALLLAGLSQSGFGQRIADAGLPVRDLQSMMRHASIITTETYYLRHRAHDQGKRIEAYLATAANRSAEKSGEQIAASAD